VAIFTPEERERLRAQLVSLAQQDPNLCGAAHTGSAASERLDRWSDIDLAFCLKREASHEQVVAEWTRRLYCDHAAVAHVDVMRGPTLFRVFLLANTLQVDIAFWRAGDFGAIGPNFLLIFSREGGEPNPPRAVPQLNQRDAIGMAWLYALHVRSSLARGRVLQAEYMLSGMRNNVCELICVRCGVVPQQGRGLDDLPSAERDTIGTCAPQSLQPSMLKRAFQNTMTVLLQEARFFDPALEARLSRVLKDMVDWV
jgi:hypothetical protein